MMSLFVITLGIILTFFSVAILSYVSIATMMGPWIAPTLVLLASIASKLSMRSVSQEQYYRDLLLIQAIGAGGGVIAVAYGFSLPILHFLDPLLFSELLATSPWYFCLSQGIVCFIAGGLGLRIGPYFSDRLLGDEQLRFPTCRLTYQLATLPSKVRQVKQLLIGSGVTLLVSLLRDGIGAVKGVLPRSIHLCGNTLVFPIWPTMWVIGFTSGYAIAVPLCIGLITQRLFCFIMSQQLFPVLKSIFFGLSMEAFTTAFCAGLILSELLLGLGKMSLAMSKRVRSFSLRKLSFDQGSYSKVFLNRVRSFCENLLFLKVWKEARFNKAQPAFLKDVGLLFSLVLSAVLFWHMELPLLGQVIYFLLLYLATYEICFFGANVGLVPFGRFSTLLLIPLLLLFKLSYLQITFVCVFFTVSAATASDLIFDNKIAQFGSLDQKTIYRAQWVGLIAASLSIGIVLYLLLTYFSLGTPEFFGQRGQSKALMIKSFDFNLYVVSIGLLYGFVLKYCKITPMMTFGGLFLPSNITTGLVVGAFVSRWIPSDRYAALCSGVLVSEVLWIMTSIVGKLFF